MKIAYLEDEPELATTVAEWLRSATWDVEHFDSGLACVRAVENHPFDVCLLDWMVPDLTGLEVMARLQIRLRRSMPPVVFTTGRDSEEDIVAVLRAGADDYLVKPLSRPLLLARIEVVTRRHGGIAGASLKQDFGRLRVDHGRRQIALDGALVQLTERETDLALYLLQNVGRVLSREQLLQVVWAVNPQVDTRTIDVHASSLRRKLHLTPEFGWRLSSIYGHGYRLEREGKDS
ncbi:response regulator transcription factor [Accumulibacter sp.]|jgi:two-component system response regulator RegX3|uniref:response regulator transcription factor n=1 Tax=Accumulibacter sp. TaxID=2053492 RepID=UPI001ACDD585|nr:response regulator transcription factor [Accumulibacter sp.]MBN8453197.1 response regulator transcription factor [Accumulibacter sp.]MBO3705613.1 response regulator transcription factor [Candidatus Accumulibacter conexus]